MGNEQGSAEFSAFVRDVVAFAGRRLWFLTLLAVAAAAAEGVGLMMLIPILGFLGIDGSNHWGAMPITLGWALVVYVLLVAAAALVVAARATSGGTLKFGFADDLRRRIHGAILAMDWRSYSRLRASDSVHVLTLEVTRAAHGLDFLLKLSAWAIEIAVLLAVTVNLSAVLTLVYLTLAVIGVLAGRPLNRKLRVMGSRMGTSNRALVGEISDDLAGLRLIRSLGLEADRQQRLADRMDEVRNEQLAFQRATSHNRAVTQIAVAIGCALAVWFSVRILNVALADTLVLMAAFARLTGAALRIQNGWQVVQGSLPAHAAATAFLNRCLEAADDPCPNKEQAGDAPMLTRSLDLDGVAFRYAPDAPAVLHGLHARIPAHAITAVVGHSGAGKSTLADLVSGLTEPSDGRVLVDGTALSGGLRKVWRHRVGYVPQDCILFHDTIRANLALANPGIGEDALWSALDAAAAADFVRSLPLGLETKLGDRGGQLSGGQRQRLALARALLAEPQLLILDEAIGALDGENEAHVLESLLALRHRLTIIIIAHRRSTIRHADHILVLEAGNLLAAGSWGDVSTTAGDVLARLSMVIGDDQSGASGVRLL